MKISFQNSAEAENPARLSLPLVLLVNVRPLGAQALRVDGRIALARLPRDAAASVLVIAIDGDFMVAHERLDAVLACADFLFGLPLRLLETMDALYAQ